MTTAELTAEAPMGTGWREGLAAPTAPLCCMQDESHLFGTLLNEAPQGILVLDDEGVIVFANLAMNVLFLPHPLEVGGLLESAGGLESVAQIVAEARSSRRRVETELRLPLPHSYAAEGSHERHYHLCASPWSEGTRRGFWVMVADRTEPPGLRDQRRS